MTKIQRTLIPGSPWLYFKLYTGIKSADSLLVNTLYPILSQLKKQQLIKQFFFIRYSDPHYHIRLRLQLSDERRFSEIISSLYKSFDVYMENGLLWNVQIDTYKREMERYGENTIEIVESIFCKDSECIIPFIRLSAHPEGEMHRWLFGLVLIDDMLSMANYDLSQKEKLLQDISEGFKREFYFTTHAYKQQLDTKYREHKKIIYEVLNDRVNSPVKAYVNLLNQRKEQIISYVKELRTTIEEKQEASVTLDSLLSSILHMSMNRLFRSQNRLHELLLYDFLHRYYESTIARNKKMKPTEEKIAVLQEN